MSGVVFRAMVLGLVRDRAALAMTFILPAVFFLIFAMIFAGATGEQLRLDIAIADEKKSDASERLLDALRAESALRPLPGELTARDVRELVRKGTADVGLIVRADGEELGSIGGFGPTPLIIISDPARGVAVPMLAGQVQRAYFSALPDIALGSVVDLLENEFIEFDEEQREALDSGLLELGDEAREALDEGGGSGWGLQDLYERENVVGQAAGLNHVAYYAGAVAVLFLLFSAVHGAISLIEERDSGILDRILAGPESITPLVDGKFIFLVVQGFAQIFVIFVIAWLVYGVDLPGHLLSWSITTAFASAAAAGLALTVATACRTLRQAQTLSNIAILVLSALGGSMVPRFFMPQALQNLGWITPNTWAIEAYTAAFWRNEPLTEMVAPWAVLAFTGLVGLVVARGLARRLAKA